LTFIFLESNFAFLEFDFAFSKSNFTMLEFDINAFETRLFTLETQLCTLETQILTYLQIGSNWNYSKFNEMVVYDIWKSKKNVISACKWIPDYIKWDKLGVLCTCLKESGKTEMW